MQSLCTLVILTLRVLSMGAKPMINRYKSLFVIKNASFNLSTSAQQLKILLSSYHIVKFMYKFKKKVLLF